MRTQNNSLFAVFEAICSRGGISRREISECTGFSQVTVGKALVLLEDGGIISRRKGDGAGVGRKGDVCSVNENHGMILFDFSGEKAVMGIYDIKLSRLFKSEGENFAELILSAPLKLAELGISQLMGIGAICGFGKRAETEKIFTDTVGNPPDIVIEEHYAYAVTVAKRFGGDFGTFVRIFDEGKADAVILNKDEIYEGSRGRAGVFADGESIEEFLHRVAGVACILDVGVIHAACKNEELCDKVKNTLTEIFKANENAAQITAEPMTSSVSAMDGLALLSRERFISKFIIN